MPQDPRPPRAPRSTPRLPLHSCLRWFTLALAFSAPASLLAEPTTGFNQETAASFATPHDYSSEANWVGGSINGIWHSSLTVEASQNVGFSSDPILETGLSFLHNGSGVNFTGVGANRTITLGGDILHNTVGNVTITFGSTTSNRALNIDLGGVTRNFTVLGGAKNLSFNNVISNGGVNVNGSGIVNFSGVNTYSGATNLSSGVLRLIGNNGSIANSAVSISGNATILTLDSSSNGNTGRVRTSDVILNGIGVTSSTGPSVRALGNATANSIDTIDGEIQFNTGFGMVTLSPNASRNTRMVADTITRQAGTLGLIRGTELGKFTAVSQTAGASNLMLGAAPTSLTGAGGASGTSTMSIIAGLVGDTGNTGNGYGGANATAPTGGLLTYDTANGVRLLNAANGEYKTSITDNQTTLDNILLSHAAGGGAISTVVTAGARINSLSLVSTGGGTNGGITLSGGELAIDSGVIYAAQFSNTQNTTNSIIVENAINFGEKEGIIQAAIYGTSSTRGGAMLDFTGVISNDTEAAKGLTISTTGGEGTVRFSGSASNTYTGVTTVNTGVVLLQKTGGAQAIFGDIVVNGGLLEVGNNQIADTSNVTINGGSFKLQIGNSGTATAETINNLVMNGGSYNTGDHDKAGNSRILGTAIVSGGNISLRREAKVTIDQKATFSGGTATVERSRSTVGTQDTVLYLNGGLDIVNTASGVYTPITLAAGNSATNAGGRAEISGGVTFVGNGTNTNAARIEATSGTTLGQVAMNGTQTFDIGDGAAATDLEITAPLVDGNAPAGLTKTGAGTLALLGASTYTGITTISGGRLAVNGSLTGTSGVVISSGASLTGSGTVNAMLSGEGFVDPGNSPGIMTVAGVDVTGGLDFNLEFTAGGNDILHVTGATPFTGAMNGNNTLTLYLDSATFGALTEGSSLLGGFYLDAGGQLANLSGASIVAYYLNAGGSHVYAGQNYSLIDGAFTLSEEANTQFVPAGTMTRFTYAPVPEPSAPALLGLGLALFWFTRHRRASR